VATSLKTSNVSPRQQTPGPILCVIDSTTHDLNFPSRLSAMLIGVQGSESVLDTDSLTRWVCCKRKCTLSLSLWARCCVWASSSLFTLYVCIASTFSARTRTHTHTHTHTSKHTHIHTHIHTNTHRHTHRHTHTRIHTPIHTAAAQAQRVQDVADPDGLVERLSKAAWRAQGVVL